MHASLATLGLALLFAAQAPDDGKRELTLTGCLLRSGYAGYQIDDAQLDAIDGKPVAKESSSNTPAPPKKWILDGGGNLGASTGRKVQVVGRSDWRAEAAAGDPPNRTPHLDVKTIKTISDKCT